MFQVNFNEKNLLFKFKTYFMIYYYPCKLKKLKSLLKTTKD